MEDTTPRPPQEVNLPLEAETVIQDQKGALPKEEQKEEKTAKEKVGRKLFDGKDEGEVIQKLEEVFALGGTDLEACLWADISKAALYNYQKTNPHFVDRKEKLKERPILKARQTVIKALQDPQHAQWFLERKKKDEFSSRSEVTGKEGKDLFTGLSDEQKAKLDSLLTQ